MQHRRGEELGLRDQRPSVHVRVRGQVLVDFVTVPEAKGVAASEERRGSAVCVLELRDSPFIGGVPPKVHGKTVLKPIFPCTNDAGHLAPRLCHGDGLWVVPMEREGTRHRERQVEGGGLQDVPFDPGQQGLETVLLCSPQEPLAILRVTAVGVGAALEEGAVVREPFAANPAHDRWRGHGKHEVWCYCRLCSTAGCR